jgi:acetylornithine deacetylase/succinyl-diaminopimelate desuccinylase-like protein
MQTYKNWFSTAEKELEARYFEFLRYPSISADHAFRPELQACANWVKTQLLQAGFSVELWNENDAPIVFASYDKAGPDKPTLLIYNHYDVQPVDPIDLWESKPFEPKRRDNLVIARGAQDNKGQCFYVLSALCQTLAKTKSLPINIKLCIEGEEESGSAGLSHLLNEKASKLQSDYLLIVDVGMPNPMTPAITLGTRGLCSCTVEVESSFTDLHSGMHGGVVYNPLHALVEIMASLRDANGHIAVPGFYDAVAAPSAKELSAITFHFDEKEFEEEHGCRPTGGEKGFAPLERAWLRPTIEMNGLTGGYGGPGSKTVIPARAQAKLSCRLVPNQDPKIISEQLKRYIEAKAPAGVKVRCIIHEGIGKPVRTSPHSPLIQALSESTKAVYNTLPQFILEGASIPIVSELQAVSQAQVAFFGLGLASDKIHAPNECFSWDRIENGFLIICDLLARLADKKQDL